MNKNGPHDGAWNERFGQLFRHAQVGRCVNGVTHDINNILGAIMAYAELAGMENDPEERGRLLEEVVNGVIRCTELIGTLTSIARDDRPTAAILEPSRLLMDLVKLRDYAARVEHIQVETHAEERLPTIVVDRPKALLALIHLVMNAQEALAGASDPKTIRLTVKRHEAGVVFEVWNSGPPLDEAGLEVAFEPFHGTKDGHHLGYGLSAARQVAVLHEGSLSYDPGRGFILYFPSRNSLISLVSPVR